MINRKAEIQIQEWINSSNNTALLVSGARQVGKTYSIRSVLNSRNKDFLEINLIEHPEAVSIFENSTSVEDLVTGLSAIMNHSFKKNETIIFIDEVQESKDIVTKIKFWVDEGNYRYILSGSLLGIELKSLRSAPVGYLHEVAMFPIDLEEFLIASGVVQETIDYLKKCFKNKEKMNDAVLDKILTHFKRFLVVGGMPAAVQEYITSHDINKVDEIQKNIIEQYKLDFTKYEEKEKKLMLISIYENIPAQLLKQNKRFNYSDIKKGLRFERLEDSFLWLSYAGVAIPAYNATEPRVSLSQNKKSSLLKLYSSDVGLLTCMLGKAAKLKILTGEGKINLGGVYENAVIQELHAHGFDAFFYNSHKNGELDFVIEKDGQVIPIEVKSGKDYYVHSAISKAVSNPEYEIDEGIVFANCNVSQEGKINYLPVFMCAFLQDDVVLPVVEAV